MNLSDRADFGVGDGTAAMTGPADVVVIAGMGGTTIAGIVEADQNRLGPAKLILQPNVAAPELRASLARCGWRILDERIARDGRRNYVVVVAERGKTDYSLKQIIVGPVLLERMPAELSPYAAFRLRVARKALAGAQAGGDAAQRAVLEQEIGIWEEVSACLKRSGISSSC